MDKSIRKYTDFDEMKADEYRCWQTRPVCERTDAVSALTQQHYAMKGEARMYPDFKGLLSALNAHGVKYLVVGAYAVSVYAKPRATKDIDILVKPDNAKAVYAALAQFEPPPEGISPADFAESGSLFRMGNEPVAVDILSEIPGLDFDGAWERRVEYVIDQAAGNTASFPSREDLIGAKLASGRRQDLADVEAIHKAERTSLGSTGRKP